MSAEDTQNSAGNANAITDQLERLNVDGEAADAAPRTEQEYAESQLTLRAIVSSIFSPPPLAGEAAPIAADCIAASRGSRTRPMETSSPAVVRRRAGLVRSFMCSGPTIC